MVTDWTGAVIQDELHYPWGKVWTMMGTQTEERFASLHHRDSATNLDPTHFRMYSSDEGRWLTPDPAKNCPYHPENFDRYNYADNNPTNRTDPRGSAVYGIDYPYIDYGLGLDAQFLPNPDAYGLPPFAGFFPPIGGWIDCEICRLVVRDQYILRMEGCTLLGIRSGPAAYLDCEKKALAAFQSGEEGCEEGPCSFGNNGFLF